jgi:23S rRNA (adenine2030-N6)-methyltransferase
MVLAETHAKEANSLRSALGRQKLLSILESDGYAAVKAQTPPRENRGLVLMDPPYESDDEFDRVLAALETGHARWPTGTYCIWYPLTDRAAPLRFRRQIERSDVRKVLGCTLSVMPDDTPVGMRGSGLVIVNPQWQLEERLVELLPDLHRLLVPDAAGGTSVEWWRGET